MLLRSVLALMASEGFLPVSQVTSPFRAATKEGNRFTRLCGLLIGGESNCYCESAALSKIEVGCRNMPSHNKRAMRP